MSCWRLVSAYPKSVIAAGAVLALICALASSMWLHLDSNQDNLISHDLPFQKRNLEQIENFGDQEYMFLVIETGGTDEGRDNAAAFARSVAARLKKRPDLIHQVHYRMTARDMGPGVLLFANPDEITAFTRLSEEFAPKIKSFTENPGLTGFLSMSADLLGARSNSSSGKSKDKSSSGFGSGPEMFYPFMGALGHAIGAMQAELGVNASKSGDTVAAGDDSILGLEKLGMHYFFTSNGKLLIMRILPKKDFGQMDVIGPALSYVRKCLDETRLEFPGVSAGLTGRPVLSADEMHTTNNDMTVAAIISVILVGLLFVVVLHGWLRPVLVLVSLGFAMAWTFGFALVFVGSLNLLSIVFALVLVGIGVDFGVHVVMRYVEGVRSGLSSDDAVKEALVHTGPGVLLGALTSVCAFYAVLGQDFVGLAELGLVGGTGILFCLISMITVLPAMMLVAGRKNWFPSSHPKAVTMPFMEKIISRPVTVLLVFAVLSILALPGLEKVGFNYNLLELQAKGLESVNFEHRLMEESDESTWFAVITKHDINDVKSTIAELRKLPSVGRIDSIFDYLPKDQAKKAALLKHASSVFKKISFSKAPEKVQDSNLLPEMDRLMIALENLEEKLFSAGAVKELKMVSELISNLDSCMIYLENNPQKADQLNSIQYSLVTEMRQAFNWVQQILQVQSVEPKDLPESLRSVFIGKDGSYMIKVSPSKNVWDFDLLRSFVSDLRKVDPEVTGVPVVVLESSQIMRNTFVEAAGITFGLVALILFLNSFSLSYVIMALVPLVGGLFWLLEIMGLSGISFNLANFFAIPILIAIGVDGGVHFLARWSELKNGERLYYTSTPVAVGLSFCTTMIGFGGLLLAHHRGMESLGSIMVTGSATCLIGCLFVLPAVFRIIENIKRK